MPVVEVRSEEEFKTITANSPNALIVVYFTGVWCTPCTRISPFVERLSAKYHRHALFLRVDYDECPALAVGHGILAMPSFLFMRGGVELLGRIEGADEVGLESKLSKLLGYEIMYAIAEENVDLDETQPTTDIIVRLANCFKLTVKLNLTHPVSAIREFICNWDPDQSLQVFVFTVDSRLEPRREIADESVSIEEADLQNALWIIQTLKD